MKLLVLTAACLLLATPAEADMERQLICRAGGDLVATLNLGGAGRPPQLNIAMSGEPYEVEERLSAGHCLVNGLGLRPNDPHRIVITAEGPVVEPPSTEGGLDAVIARDAAFQALLERLEDGDGWFAVLAVKEADYWRALRAFPCDDDGCR